VVKGCKESSCVYIAGETAEMPGFYKKDEYDLAGFATGVFDQGKLISGKKVRAGDIIVGIASNGLHSNGFSLVRKVFPPLKIRKDKTLLKEILKPTRIYVRTVLSLMTKFDIHAAAHITGGGVFGKLSKVVPDALTASLERDSWSLPSIFKLIQEKANVSEKEMFSTFNMGLGMVLIVPRDQAIKVRQFLEKNGEAAFLIGEVRGGAGKEKVKLI